MYCGKCGKENKDGAAFCFSCGSPLKEIKREETDDKIYDRTTNDNNSGNVSNITISMGDSGTKHTHGGVEGEGMSIASMILGIVALVSSCCFYYVSIPCAILSLVLAAVAIKTKRNGRGMAIAGLACSIVSLVRAIIMISTGAAIISLF